MSEDDWCPACDRTGDPMSERARVRRKVLRDDIAASMQLCRLRMGDVERHVNGKQELIYPGVRALAAEAQRLAELCAQQAILIELEREDRHE